MQKANLINLFMKIGFAEADYIMSQLPEFKKMDGELKAHFGQLENQMKLKSDEYAGQIKILSKHACINSQMLSGSIRRKNWQACSSHLKNSKRTRRLLIKKSKANC